MGGRGGEGQEASSELSVTAWQLAFEGTPLDRQLGLVKRAACAARRLNPTGLPSQSGEEAPRMKTYVAQVRSQHATYNLSQLIQQSCLTNNDDNRHGWLTREPLDWVGQTPTGNTGHGESGAVALQARGEGKHIGTVPKMTVAFTDQQ